MAAATGLTETKQTKDKP